MANKKAYSYVRFSTAEQLKGKSLERQTEAAAAWCRQHGATLDTALSLHDLGVSAFRGKNAATGALKVFLDRVDDGTIPRGSFLLIETFDRMSRESAYDAQLTLQNIINGGITVVTLLDGKQYSVQILRSDPLALIYAILLMSRGHEESVTKAHRVSDAWARKRQRLKAGDRMTRNVPGWLVCDAQRKTKAVPARVRVVKLMFNMYLKGSGILTITKHLNAKGVPTFLGKPYWYDSYVIRTLRNRAVLGEFQPQHGDSSSHLRKRTPDGPPIKNYYPAIIEKDMFNRVQALLKTASIKQHRQNPGTRIASLLVGLGVCSLCGSALSRTSKVSEKGEPRYRYVCQQARVGGDCDYHSVRVDLVEGALINHADALAASAPGADPKLKQQLKEMDAAFAEADRKVFDLSTLLDSTPSKAIAHKIQEAEEVVARLLTERGALAERIGDNEPKYIHDRVKRMRDALSWHGADRSELASVNAKLRECFEKIVLHYDGRLECVWRHQPKSSIIRYSV